MAEVVKASIHMGEKLVIFEGPRDFVQEQVERFADPARTSQPALLRGSVRKRGGRRSADGAVDANNTSSCTGRILSLRNEGFFTVQRTISDVRNELASHGWHYPLTTLSGRLQSLVQQRFLRREKVKDRRKKVWKYSNV
jgi:hypothetical protein